MRKITGFLIVWMKILAEQEVIYSVGKGSKPVAIVRLYDMTQLAF